MRGVTMIGVVAENARVTVAVPNGSVTLTVSGPIRARPRSRPVSE
jgi:hypothetical protein